MSISRTEFRNTRLNFIINLTHTNHHNKSHHIENLHTQIIYQVKEPGESKKHRFGGQKRSKWSKVCTKCTFVTTEHIHVLGFHHVATLPQNHLLKRV